MRSWVFRNRALLEAIYGRASRRRPLTELVRSGPRAAGALRVVLYELPSAPRPRLVEARPGRRRGRAS